jgi:leucyl-tRNA synthetase
MMTETDFTAIDARWQKFWTETDLYGTPGDVERDDKFYLLEMYAYPSGDIHIGHFRNYTVGDVMWRYLRMKGKKMLHPFGWDSFGLPAEQAAIKRGIQPAQWTEGNIATGRETLTRLGISYDWDREVVTSRDDYYRWTQWIFLKLFEKGLTYQEEGGVNWCPECNTVLANEQVLSTGTCWRHEETKVEKRFLKQWYFRITDYAQRLLDGLDGIEKDWPASTVAQQRNWIGRSEGAEINFTVTETQDDLPIFTTRPDTIYGVTFMAIAPDAKLMRKLTPICPNREAVEAYALAAQAKTEIERTAEGVEKDGVDTGLKVRNPFNGKEVPLFVADYVLAGYGCGAVMAVPAHDQRDFEFAKKYGLPIVAVIHPEGEAALDPGAMTEACTAYGVMHNSDRFDGKTSSEGIADAAAFADSKGFGRATVNFRLRDWLISRQRYWGAPIPIIHCDKCGAVPVPEKDLPVLLPEVEDFIPRGRSPLEDVEEFVNTTCPRCDGAGRRDADTMDTFVCSSWYQFRYSDPHNGDLPFTKEKVNTWLPVDLYIGGTEHAMGHLIYFRFITKVLHDLGYVDCDEPAKSLFHHGMVLDATGEKMSKSKGNVVSPVKLINEWGVDIPRLAMLFLAPPSREILWTEKGLVGAKRFLLRYTSLVESLAGKGAPDDPMPAPGDLSGGDAKAFKRLNQTIRKVTGDIEDLQFNTAIAALMELLNDLADYDPGASKIAGCLGGALARLIAPFAPHLAEELWSIMGGAPSIYNGAWPSFDEAACREEEVTIAVQIKGKMRGRVTLPRGATEEDVLARALADEKIKRHVPDQKAIRKVIFVPDRILNLIV